jgi:hypothetical protein
MIKDHASRLRHNGSGLQLCDHLSSVCMDRDVHTVHIRHKAFILTAPSTTVLHRIRRLIVLPAKPSWSTHALQPQPCVSQRG